MEDLSGMQLGQYQILAPLGEGGMAAVFKAYQPRMERHVALKVLPRHFASDPEFTGRFEQEAKLIAQLQHVHILPVHDYGEDQGYAYIVMPYIETGTLSELLQGQPLPLRQVREVIAQVGEALAYAHEKGLVHRDVKPSNILIDRAGNCLLTDFGIAKIVGGTTKFTQTGAIIGTPAYMSPEQIRGETLDGRSDQYSLGIVLFEMATGRSPYRAETPPAIFVKHLHDPLPLPRSLNPDLPEELELVILKCLSKDPADRYASMPEMVDAVGQALPEAALRTRAARDELAQAATVVGAGRTEVRETAAAPAAEAEARRPTPLPETVARDEQAPALQPVGVKRLPTWLWAVGGLLALGLVAAVGLWALGGPSEPAAETPAATAAPPAAAVEPIEPTQVPIAGSRVTIFSAAGEEQLRRFEQNFTRFEQRTGIDVVVEGSPDFEALAMMSSEAGDPYDILNFPQPGLMADMARAGFLVDLSEFIPADELHAAYSQTWIDLGTVDGRIYGVWHGADIKSLVWYSRPAFEAAGYQIPQSWEELMALSDQIVADGGVPWCVGIQSEGSSGWPGTDWIEDILLRTIPPELYDAWTRGELKFASPEVRRAFEILEQIWFREGYVLGDANAIATTSFAASARQLFEDPPSCWMHRQASFTPNFFPEGIEVGRQAGFFYLPPIDERFGRPALISGNLISLAKDTPAGREVVKFMLSPESIEAEIRAGDVIAPMQGVPMEWYPSDARRGYAEILHSATVVRFDGSDLMPGAVGAGSFWAAMVDWVNGAALDDLLPAIDASWPGAERAAGPFECTDPIGCVRIGPDEPLHIAYMLSLSGPTGFLGEDSLGAIELAIDDRGRELLGHPILLTGEDSACSAEGGLLAAEKLAADATILGIIGTNCSSAMTAAMSTISGSGLVILSPSNTAPALTLEGGTWQPGYFRVAHTDLLQGQMAAEFAIKALGARRAATIQDGSPYSDQLQAVFARQFQALGGTITFQGALSVGDADLRNLLASAGAGSPDVLYFPIFEPEGDFLVQQAGEIAGLQDTALMGADGLLVDAFPENAGPNAIGMYLSGPFVAGSRYEEFLDKWRAKYGGVPPSGFHAFAYDATSILLHALERVAFREPDGTLHLGRQALREAIKAIDGFPGITGVLSCADRDFGEVGISKGDCATGQALGVFHLTEAEVLQGNWPPEVVWRLDE